MSDIIEIYSNLYKHQKDCIDSKKRLSKSLINIWCGGGKTRIIVYSIFDDDKEVNVIVFPSLGLINQFNNDYILSEDFMDYFKEYHCLSVCSDSDKKLNPPEKIDKSRFPNIKYTTDKRQITSTLKKDGKKLFTVTYQSLEMFMNIIIEKNITINRLYYDEAHHILGHNIQNIVFKNDKLNELIEKTEFYTATPDNKNGITMYDKDNPENSDCGPIAYEYLFYQAVKDEVSKDFTMKLMLYPKTKEDMYINLFKSIFRECFTGDYDYWNILTFHSMVEEKDDMATVNQLSKKEKLFKKCFLEVIEEFPEMKSIYSVENVFLKGIGSKTKKRESIIKDFDKPEKGRIYLIASCKTLGEGIDTKYANMEIPINPGGSVVYEQQKLGRITRNPGGNNPNGIVLIPCWIDMEKYEGLDKYQRDEMIRQELHEGGNFNTFLNVMSAYKNQEDPESWELCLKYPKMYSPKEIKSNLDKQGFKVDESKGDLIDNVNHILDKDISDLVGETDEETIQNIVSTGKQVEIHSQDKDLPIITYGSSSGSDEEPIRLFKDENDVYHPVSKKESSENRRKIERPDKLKRNKLVNVHMNDEIKVLWKIDESSFDSIDGEFCHGVLDAEIDYNEEKWYECYDFLKEHMKTNGNKCPSPDWKLHDTIHIGSWLNSQRQKKKRGTLNGEKIKLLEEISGWFWSIEDIWCDIYELLKEYMLEYKSYPKQNYITDYGIKLGNWVVTQRMYKRKGKLSEKKIKLLEELPGWIWDIDLDIIWMKNYKLLKGYMENNDNLPPPKHHTEDDIKLGSWVGCQRIKKDKLSEGKIKLLEKIPGWYWDFNEELMKTWYNNYNLLKKYMENNDNTPPQKYIIGDVKLGLWVSSQRSNKKLNKLDEKQIQLLEELPGWLWDANDVDKIWKEKYDILKKYIEKHNNIPVASFIDDSGFKLGRWVVAQKTNKKKNKLSNERIKLLEGLPDWLWEIDVDKPWYGNYNIVKEYIIKNKNLPISSYINENGVKLGVWIGTQRSNKKLNKLCQEKIKLLEELPEWLWDANNEPWYENYEILKKHVFNYNDIPSQKYVNNDGIKLGTWVSSQRSNKKLNKLSEDKIKLLKELPGWKWNFEDQKTEHWNKNYKLVKKYVNEKLEIPNTDYITDDNIKLGGWINRQRYTFKKGKLSDDKIKLLEKLSGWKWEIIDESWSINYNLLKKYMENNDNNFPPHNYITEDGIKLSDWCSNRRADKKKNKLSQEKIDLLEKIPGWLWEVNVDTWSINYNLLKEYMKENANNTPTQTSKLGKWVAKQRTNKRNNKISDERVKLLEELPGWVWKVDLDIQWNENYEILKIYMIKNQNQLPSQKQIINGNNIGSWVSLQRSNYKNENIDKKRIQLLEELNGWIWDLDKEKEIKWNEHYNLVKNYITDNKKSPVKECKINGIAIGNWVDKQRQEKKKNKLSKEKIDLLEKIPGWYWSAKDKNKKDMSKKEIKSKKETTEQKQQRVLPILSQLHKLYKTMNSQTLHKHFEDNPEDWENYHKISEENEETFPDEEIPYKKIIEYLDKIPGKKAKDVVDLGCGKARVCEHFSDSERFKFINMDHVSCNDLVQKQDIKDTGLDDYSMDIVVLSLAMWGSNCKEYITESNRILDENGVLLIIEATKRWTDDETGENKLVKLLEKNNFTIKNINEEKFMFIECIKK